MSNVHNSLPCQIREFNICRDRCSSIVEKYFSKQFETVTTCNICETDNILIVASSDRYGIPIRSGMCLNCSLIFLVERLTEDGYSQFYKDYYRPILSAYLGRTVDVQSIQKEQILYGQNLLRVFHGLIDLNKNHTLIDIGGSTGLVASEYVKEYGLSATILDPSPHELKSAQENGLGTICDLFERWNWDGDQYDLVLCCRTIDHFYDLIKSLVKLRNLIKPSGFLLIDIIDVEAMWMAKGIFNSAIKVDHVYYLCSENAPQILAQAGLQVVYSEIVTNEGRVTYICRPTNDGKTAIDIDNAWMVSRIRRIQESNLAVSESKRLPCGWKQAIHEWLYHKKQYLMKSRKI